MIKSPATRLTAIFSGAVSGAVVLCAAPAFALAAAPAPVRAACHGAAQPRCAATDYCKVEAPLAKGKEGVCTPKPEICPMVYIPVCGEDGKTYPNDCHAARAGVNTTHAGACTK